MTIESSDLPPDDLARIEVALRNNGLTVLGGLQVTPGDAAPAGTNTLLLLGPDEPAFWPIFSSSPEYVDGGADPLDRWSLRVIGGIAQQLSAQALFPFGGPPHAPFYSWALRSGRAWPSPVNLLVHDTRGLFVSYRGALALDQDIELPPVPTASPCDGCPRPCLDACPVEALGAKGYDVPACIAYLEGAQGTGCLQGCAVRAACPVGRTRRLAAQSAFHMRAFIAAHSCIEGTPKQQ